MALGFRSGNPALTKKTFEGLESDSSNATMTLDDSDFRQRVDLSKIIVHRKNSSSSDPSKLIVDISAFFASDVIFSRVSFCTEFDKITSFDLEIEFKTCFVPRMH